MPKKPTKEEINDRILKSGVDARTDDIYVRADTPMEFYCSKGHRWKTKLGNVTHNHQGCPYCSGRYAIIGENDLWTVYPEIAELLVDKDEGYSLLPYSTRKTFFKCPNCGTISHHMVGNVVRRGFSCPVCSDGISYPNKFAASMLNQIGIDYIPEYVFDGSKYRYDFYIKDFSLIIEMHGKQHYEEWKGQGRTLEEEQENDKEKMDFAIQNGIKNYIVIDSKCSDINYISKNILSSNLSVIFNLSNVDWRQCGYYASGSLVHETAKLYNDGISMEEISCILKYSKDSIRNFLKKATQLQLCDYVPGTGFLREKHKVILLNTEEVFSSISDASRKYHVSIADISRTCLRKSKYAGFDYTTRIPLVWRYFEDYDPEEIIDFKLLINPHINYNTKL